MLAIKSTGSGTHFTAFDGNGNIVALASVTNASVTAQYDYEPFGDLLRETGPMAKLSDFGFSTKRLDRETEALYYGYRYFRHGRWLSKDPIEERGGRNLYAFLKNSAPGKFDKNGWEEGVTIITRPLPVKGEPNCDFGTRKNDSLGYDGFERDLSRQIAKHEIKNPDHIVLTVTSIGDANDKIQRATKCCVANLEITGHGGQGVQNVASENSERGGSFIYATENPATLKPTFSGMEMFAGIKFCKPCTITMRGCGVGSGKQGDWLLGEIHRITGCQVKAYSDKTYNGMDGCLPGSCNLFGMGAPPNVVVPPRAPEPIYGP